ncbi:hypothetical protein [Pseudomonas aeruginosa]|uniref:hypothetical protein n=1 Tax=Pseudomonas aeruginosa TaxID=287 RepID=UPI001179959D|nr:hypothetical protein [Pseudomonas aeruginosa]
MTTSKLKTKIAIASLAIAALSAATFSAATVFSNNHEITSAVIKDKTNDFLGMESNGLASVSLSDAWDADKSTVSAVKFLQCSVSLPKFKFVSLCHKLKHGSEEMNRDSLRATITYSKIYNNVKNQGLEKHVIDALVVSNLIMSDSNYTIHIK